MRLFLSDTFFEKFIKLPKNVQQKVLEFQRKFRSNSISAAIHLEPITQFKDNSLRTARIAQGYRAIIGVMGDDNFSLLYVDQHDDAYRWAQNKRFAWNEHTQSCQLVQADEEVIAMDAAVQQPEENLADGLLSAIPKEKLLRIGIPEEYVDKVKRILDLDDLDKLEKYLPEDAFENLFNLLDEGDIDEIIANIEAGRAQQGEDALLSDNNKRHFIELTDDEYLAKIIEQDMEKWQIFLHPSQRKLVDSNYKGTMKVSGSAGTGKTIAAMHRLKKICSQPGIKALFTTYTTTLRANIEPLVNKLGIPQERYLLMNIDQVLMSLAKEYGFIKNANDVMDYKGGDNESKKLLRSLLDNEVSEFEENFLYDEYVDVIVYNNCKDAASYYRTPRKGRAKGISRKQRVEIWKLIEKYIQLKKERGVVDRLELFNRVANYLNENNIRPYTHVIADEFQDFSNPELRFLRALVAEGPNDLFLTGDPFQRIYSGRKMNFSAAGINVRGVRSRKLKVNYRTTEEIKKQAVAILKGEKYDDMDGGVETMSGYISLMHGLAPVYKMVDNADEENSQVLEWIRQCEENGIELSDICIAAHSFNQLKELQNKLHQSDIHYLQLKSAENRVGSKDGIRLCTFHSLKGLEFKVVILVGVNERNIPSKVSSEYPFTIMDKSEQKEYLTSIRSLLYVAITRARQLVFMTGYGEKCGLLK